MASTIPMKHTWAFALALTACASATPALAQWDGMLNRLGDRLGKKVEDSVGQREDKVIDKAFNTGDKAAACATGDPGCGKPTGPAKCAASDKACLTKAKANGQTVEITGD